MENHNEFTREFIESYQALPCLWRVKSKEYSNRQLKGEAFGKLIELCRKYVPTADLKYVKQKIQNLRTVYKKELNKVEASKRSGAAADEIYQPRLWYYDMLSFTNDHEHSRDSSSTLETEDNVYLDKNTSNDEATTSNTETTPFVISQETCGDQDAGASQSSSQQMMSQPSANTLPKRPEAMAFRKRSREQQLCTKHLLNISEKLMSSPIDEFEGLGYNVAGKMRRMAPDQQIVCERIINEALAKGIQGQLRTNTNLTDQQMPEPQFTQSHQHYAPPHSYPQYHQNTYPRMPSARVQNANSMYRFP
ncbi:uncharacterized protein [Dendropsophus ebraccatus]|uniref:uncharacterized protein n=1 Tax=Dendropsophus ebraccatus TaxID=150705 RepID=UPI003831A378